MTCSRYKKVFLFLTFYLTYTHAFQVWGVKSFLHSSHWVEISLNSTLKVYWRVISGEMSFYTVILILILLECSSVHMKFASRSLSFLSPLIFLRQIPRSSFDSLWQRTQFVPKYLEQYRHQGSINCLGRPWVMSLSLDIQARHILVLVWEGAKYSPHSAHGS